MAHKNAVFIMLDSLQYNYLGCYGNDWIKTPHFDDFANRSTLFENCYTEGLPTIPCRRAMMTGRYTLPVKGWGPLDADDTTIADLCWGRGIHTALIYDSAPMDLPKYGYNRGFHDVIFKHGHEMDHYYYAQDKLFTLKAADYYEPRHVLDANGKPKNIFSTAIEEELECYLKRFQTWRDDSDSYVGVLSLAAVKWLDEVEKTKPFLLWLDSFDPHEPWAPVSVWNNTPCPYDPNYKGKDVFLPIMGDVEGLYTEEECNHVRMLYAECVSQCDKYIGMVFDKIRQLGLWDDTMIMVTSDHGEPMGNGEHGHGIMRKCRPWPYEELAHTPLIIHLPGYGEGKRLKGFVQSCDVAPTMADWLGIHNVDIMHGKHALPVAKPDQFQGYSLLPMIRGEVEKVRDFAIAGYFGASWAIYTEDYSFVHWIAEETDFTNAQAIDYMSKTGADAMDNLVTEAHKTYKTTGGYKDTSDDEELWTCTLGSERIVPDGDELYDRHTDKFQQHNIIKEKSDVAQKLFKQLKLFMADLRAS